jgi:hypothetical protein
VIDGYRGIRRLGSVAGPGEGACASAIRARPSRAIAIFERGDCAMKVGAVGDCDGPCAGGSDRS